MAQQHKSSIVSRSTYSDPQPRGFQGSKERSAHRFVSEISSPAQKKQLNDRYEQMKQQATKNMLARMGSQDSERTRNLIWEKEKKLQRNQRQSLDDRLQSKNKRIEYKDYLKEVRLNNNFNADLPPENSFAKDSTH